MGKGDKRTKKGKTVIGSYGNSRPHKPHKQKAAKDNKKAESKA